MITLLYFYFFIEIIHSFLISYGTNGSLVSFERTNGSLFNSLGIDFVFFILINAFSMFCFGFFISFILTRHFRVVTKLINQFLSLPEDSQFLEQVEQFSKKYVLTHFLYLFFQTQGEAGKIKISMDSVKKYLDKFKKVFLEKHVLLELLILFFLMIGFQIYFLNSVRFDFVEGVYNFTMNSIVIDDLSKEYVTAQVNQFNDLFWFFLIFHVLILILWGFFLTRKIMQTNFSYIRALRDSLNPEKSHQEFVFVKRSNDPSLDCAESLHELFKVTSSKERPYG